MKLQLMLIISASLLFSVSLNAQQPLKQVTSANDPHNIQYKNLKIGNPGYQLKLMREWKSYENNKFDITTSDLASNVVLILADGSTVKGIDNFYKISQEMRNSLASVELAVYACTTLKSEDDPEHEFVVIWGSGTDTKQDGTTQKARIHEIWAFNNNTGKVDQIIQYLAAMDPESQSNQRTAQTKNSEGTYNPFLGNLSFGSPAYTDIVLKIGKDFEFNSLDNSLAFFANDVVGKMPDGTVINGKENLLRVWKDYRNNVNEMNVKVMACTTLKSPDEPEHEFGYIWLVETHKESDGRILKTNVNEVFWFNKEGKVDKFYQFVSAMPKENNK